MTPEELIERHGGVAIRRSNTIELQPERWEPGPERTERNWGVGAFVARDGAVLLVEEDGQWMLPGGVLEPGERHAEGAARELREETGLEVTIDGLLAVSEQTFVDAADGRAFDFHFATFRGVPDGGALTDDPGIQDEEIEAVEWHHTVPENTFDRELVVELFDDS